MKRCSRSNCDTDGKHASLLPEAGSRSFVRQSQPISQIGKEVASDQFEIDGSGSVWKTKSSFCRLRLAVFLPFQYCVGDLCEYKLEALDEESAATYPDLLIHSVVHLTRTEYFRGFPAPIGNVDGVMDIGSVLVVSSVCVPGARQSMEAASRQQPSRVKRQCVSSGFLQANCFLPPSGLRSVTRLLSARRAAYCRERAGIPLRKSRLEIVAGNAQPSHHGVQRGSGHSEAGSCGANHTAALPKHTNDMVALHLLERGAPGGFHGIFPYFG